MKLKNYKNYQKKFKINKLKIKQLNKLQIQKKLNMYI